MNKDQALFNMVRLVSHWNSELEKVKQLIAELTETGQIVRVHILSAQAELLEQCIRDVYIAIDNPKPKGHTK